MRTTKFRGLRKTQPNCWIYGDLVRDSDTQVGIVIPPARSTVGEIKYFFVRSSSVGQWIGEYDSKNVEIYEGDILLTDEAGWTGQVVFDRSRFILVDNNAGFSTEPNWHKCEVIGNMEQNPELLKKGRVSTKPVQVLDRKQPGDVVLINDGHAALSFIEDVGLGKDIHGLSVTGEGGFSCVWVSKDDWPGVAEILDQKFNGGNSRGQGK